MPWIRTCIALGLLTAIACRRSEAPSTERAGLQAPKGPVVQDRRFSGTLRLQSPGGPQTVRVEITNLDIANQQTIQRYERTFEGTLIMNLHAGEVTTTAEGQQQRRTQGQIWTVPPGAAFGIATGQDAASLQTILVGK
jgi:quercetin dioxygenase-like cupin family protein